MPGRSQAKKWGAGTWNVWGIVLPSAFWVSAPHPHPTLTPSQLNVQFQEPTWFPAGVLGWGAGCVCVLYTMSSHSVLTNTPHAYTLHTHHLVRSAQHRTPGGISLHRPL